MTSANGTLEWWCPRRFDAAPVLTRLLDPNGIAVGFRHHTARSQRYLDGTMLLRTVLAGPESLLEVTDTLWEGRIVRRVRALRGPALVTIAVASGRAREVSAWSQGFAFDSTIIRCGLTFAPGPTATAETTLDTGEELVITIDHASPGAKPLTPDGARLVEDRAARAWHSVFGRIDIEGRWADAAARSALVVHALSGFGAPVLSPVTSLPRVVGGERNRDGRVISPLVAAMWASVAGAIGLAEDADAATRWLGVALDRDPPLPMALGLDADDPPSEAVMTGLPGWHRSQPVVSGTNDGERISVEPAAAAIAVGRWAPSHADWIADHWAGADASVWGLGPRDERWIAPRLAARRALLAAASAARADNPLDLDAANWHQSAHSIGFDAPVLPSIDASIVRVTDLGPWPADDPVVRATLDAVAADLGDGVWIHPYAPDIDDGLEGTEPPSVIATLWLARALALAGQWDEAHDRVDAAAALAGPLHLLPEAIDVASRSPLGNRPSAAAHVAFIGAALALASAPD